LDLVSADVTASEAISVAIEGARLAALVRRWANARISSVYCHIADANVGRTAGAAKRMGLRRPAIVSKRLKPQFTAGDVSRAVQCASTIRLVVVTGGGDRSGAVTARVVIGNDGVDQ
jgi:hypothetical protein